MVFELLSFLVCAVGIYCLVCLFLGHLMLPGTSRGTWVIVWGVGAGDDLEQRVRGLMSLQNWGLLRCSVVIADAGLDDRGRALAARLIGRWPTLTLCTKQELEYRMNMA